MHPTLPRGEAARRRPGAARADPARPAHDATGVVNLTGALRRAMALCGFETLKELQKAEPGRGGRPLMAETGLADEFPPASSSTSAPSTPSSSPGVREAHVYSEIVPSSVTAAEVREAGGGAHPLGRPQVGARRGRPARPGDLRPGRAHPRHLLRRPAHPQQPGEVARGGKGEYGRTTLTVTDDASSADAAGLLADQPTTRPCG